MLRCCGSDGFDDSKTLEGSLNLFRSEGLESSGNSESSGNFNTEDIWLLTFVK